MRVQDGDGGVLVLSPDGTFATEEGAGAGTWTIERQEPAAGDPPGNRLVCTGDDGAETLAVPIEILFDNLYADSTQRLLMRPHQDGAEEDWYAWNGIFAAHSASTFSYELIDPAGFGEDGQPVVLSTLTFHAEVRLEPGLSQLTIRTNTGATWLRALAPVAGQTPDNDDLLSVEVEIANQIGDEWVPLYGDVRFAGRWRLGDGELRFIATVDEDQAIFIGADLQLKAVAAGLQVYTDENHSVAALLTIAGRHDMGPNEDDELVWKLSLGYSDGGVDYEAHVSGAKVIKLGSQGNAGTVRLGGTLEVQKEASGTRIELDLEAKYEVHRGDVRGSIVFKATRTGGEFDLHLAGQVEARAGDFTVLFTIDYGKEGLAASFKLNTSRDDFELVVDLLLKPGEKAKIGLSFRLRWVWVDGELVAGEPEKVDPLAKAEGWKPSLLAGEAPTGWERIGAAVTGAAGRAAGDGAIRLLLLPGVGGNHHREGWDQRWRDAIAEQMALWSLGVPLTVRHQAVDFDDLFEKYKLEPADWIRGIRDLLQSGLRHGILGGRRALTRGFLSDLSERVRWTAGMVVQWAADDALREETRRRLRSACQSYHPHVIVAHSLGSLIAYDTFGRDDGRSLLQNRWLVCFGSQIGNPFVRREFGGRVDPLQARFWYQLYNPRDDVLVTPLDVPPRDGVSNYRQIICDFEWPGVGDHGAVDEGKGPGYLDHEGTSFGVWRPIVDALRHETRTARGAAFPAVQTRPERTADFTPLVRRAEKHRALLVGINDYPGPELRLEGCVNDVYLMSSVLQEMGFPADGVRLLLNERATAEGIRGRLDWLLEDVEPGSQRVLYYSGHGAQIPAYGAGEAVDTLDECLVPHDFDWSLSCAILDDDIYGLYSQLPYDCRLTMVFDCCHSGGIARGGVKVRGLTPPPDIQHRQLAWDAAAGRWDDRALPPPTSASVLQEEDWVGAYLGAGGVERKLGRAYDLRTMPRETYNRRRDLFGHHGPYLPVILQACAEHQFAYEYRQGPQSYGAFTYHLAKVLRARRQAGEPVTYPALVRAVGDILEGLHYDQHPQVLGPPPWLKEPVGAPAGM